ncbi:EthD domain protein [Kalmanozyma brasiliensis GHG001]|uniref:EthD domain-containing protein n=1 Tax=Kalmanozyma brasiliensis (strain GHG001) TaxID=1365824 RepID=V5F1L6_KALBG|nr:EthD domain protein [Kalmanozyma brasiliensis GHG001]EST09189.1 EthD domain protein [Kalmanozyma brasiliensis GHG001]
MSASASSASPGQWAKVVKVTVNLTKKEGVSDQEFSRYYAQTHGALAAPVLLRHNCISYSQFHCMSDKAKDPIMSIFGPDVLDPQNAVQIAQVDGCSTFLFASLDDARSFFHDPETATVLAADSTNFTNPATVHFSIGDEYVVIKDGKILDA